MFTKGYTKPSVYKTNTKSLQESFDKLTHNLVFTKANTKPNPSVSQYSQRLTLVQGRKITQPKQQML